MSPYYAGNTRSQSPWGALAVLAVTLIVGFLLLIWISGRAQGQDSQKEVAIVCFTATWCPNCPSQKAVVERVSKSNSVSVLWVDIDQSKAVANAYRVQRVPTTLVCLRQPKANSAEKVLTPLVRIEGISSQEKMIQYITEARR